ncbi:MAG: divalent metal cation transporter [Massilia sp.]
MARAWKSYLRQIGPGFITGVSDDDPSGIATYSQAGAQFGTSLLWVALFFFPLMAAVQEICARIGRVSGHGLAGNIRRYFPPAWLYVIVFLITVSNTINIGADIAGMAAALKLSSAPTGYASTPS